MGSNAARIALVCALGSGLLLSPGTTPAAGRHEPPVFRSAPGQEVVNGNYRCDGTVYTDDQPASVSANALLTATSDITPSGFFGTSQSTREVPADLDAMASICDAHVAAVLSRVPRICTLGPLLRDRGEFGNGASVVAQFDFSCQGTRDEVIGVIGGFSRLALLQRLP
jgi:hypothetical protein